MSLFQLKDFIMHSGKPGWFKIECDYLTDMDWVTLATIIVSRFPYFGSVVGVPTGGLKLESALRPYITKGSQLIVDDVLTTGKSMEEQREFQKNTYGIESQIGVVVFARTRPAGWIYPVFQMWGDEAE